MTPNQRSTLWLGLLWLLISPLWVAVLAYEKARALIRRLLG